MFLHQIRSRLVSVIGNYKRVRIIKSELRK